MARIITILITLGILTACGQAIDSNMSAEVESFTFTNQDNEKVSLDSLKGDWWVANMIFTSCTTVCPPMTGNMSRLQLMLEEEGLDAKLVSFSVDPEVDTPEKLKEYGERFQADFANWSFLTGYEFEEIKTFGRDSFKAIVDKVPDSDQMLHVTSFFLVNPEGKVIKRYNGNQAVEMEKIVEDLKIVQ